MQDLANNAAPKSKEIKLNFQQSWGLVIIYGRQGGSAILKIARTLKFPVVYEF